MTTKQKQKTATTKPKGIDFDKVNEAVVDRHLMLLHITPKKSDLRSKVQALQIQQREKTKPDSLSEPCEVCGGQSDVDNLPDCPFCGTAGAESPEEAAAAIAKQAPIEVVEATGAHIVISGKGGLKDLHAAEKLISEAQDAGVHAYYDLGVALRLIFEHNLFKHEVGADGKAIYKSWPQYVAVKHDISGKQAMDIMHVASAFSREDIKLIGVDRLRTIVRYPEKDRVKLLEKARASELPRVALREYVAANPPPKNAVDINANTDKPGFRGGKEASTKGQENSVKAKAQQKPKKASIPPPPPVGGVAVVHQMGRQKVNLMTRKDPKKRATSLAQDPFCVIVHADGIEQLITIVKEAKGLALSIVTKRVSEKESAA